MNSISSTTIDDSSDLSSSNWKPFGDCFVRHFGGERSYKPHIVITQLVRPISVSSFLDFIVRVYLVVSKKQMARINTWRKIATMEHRETFRDIAVVQNPRRSVRVNERGSQCPQRDNSITIGNCCRSPNPTSHQFRFVRWYRTVLINLRPKTLSERYGEALRKCGILSTVSLHKSVRLICAALRAVSAAPGHLQTLAFSTIKNKDFCAD